MGTLTVRPVGAMGAVMSAGVADASVELPDSLAEVSTAVTT